MPTTANEIFYVDTGSTVGGDGTTDATTGANRAFASLADADTNIPTASKDIGSGFYCAILCNNSGGADTTKADFGTDWTFGNASSILYVMSNDDTNANTDPLGIATKTCHYDGTPGSGYVINVFDTCLSGSTAVNLHAYGIETDGDDRTFRSGILGGEDSAAVNCVAHNIANGIKVYRGTHDNCLTYDCSDGFNTYGNFGNSDYKNCTAVDNTVNGFETSTGGSNPPSLYNCVAFGNGTNYHDDGSGWGTSEFNAGETGDTIPGTDSVTGITSAAFLDYALDDFRIGSGSALEDAGGSNGTTFDVEGTTRSSADIGFFEYVATGSTLLTDAVAQSVSLDAAVLVQGNLASPDAIGQASALDATTLAQSHLMSPDELGQASALDASALVQGYVASPDELSQSSTLDASALVQGQVTSPDELGQASTLDASTLAQGVTANPDAIEQASALDATALVQANTASPDELAQTATLDGTTLQQGIALTPAELVQAVTLDNGSISEAASITPAELFQSVTLDGSSLVIAGALAVQDIDQASALDPASLIESATISPAELVQAVALDGAVIIVGSALSPEALGQAVSLDASALVVGAGLIPAELAQSMGLDSTALLQGHILAAAELTQAQLLAVSQLPGTALKLGNTLIVRDSTGLIRVTDITGAFRVYEVDTI